MSDPTTMTRPPLSPYDPAQLSGVDARVSALEHAFDGFRTDFANFAREIRGMLNKPRDWSSTWGALGLGVTLMLAGITALYTVMTSADASLAKDIAAVKESLSLETQRTAAVEKVDLLESRLQRINEEHALELEQERRMTELKVLLSSALRNSATHP